MVRIFKRGWNITTDLGDEGETREQVLKKAQAAKERSLEATLEDPTSDAPSSHNFDSPEVEAHSMSRHHRH